MVFAEIASHVFTVEFHVYIYHLLDHLPDWDLPKLPNSSNGAENTESDLLDVTVVKTDGTVSNYKQIAFPKRFNNVLDFYLFDLEPIFFPSYEYHILSPKVILKHCTVQSWYKDNLYLYVVPELMMNEEMKDLKSIQWSTSRGMEYRVDFVEGLAKNTRKLMIDEPVPEEIDRKPIITETKVDLRPICPKVQNQGDLGTCGVAALTSFLEYITDEKLSVLYLYYTTRVLVHGHLPNDDSGVEIAECVEAISKYGICREETWPYDLINFPERPSERAFEEAGLFKPGGSFRRLMTIEEMKHVLRKGLPFIADINFAPLSYGRKPAETGKIPKPRTMTELDPDSCEHTVLIVGFDDVEEEFIFQNSWGTSWGVKGFGFLPYGYFLNQGMFRNAITWSTSELPRRAFPYPPSSSR